MKQQSLDFYPFPEISFEVRPVTEQVTFVKIGNEEFNAYHISRILDELEDTDPVGSRMILPQKFVKVLENTDVVRKSTQGSLYKGDRFEEFLRHFIDVQKKFLNEEDK